MGAPVISDGQIISFSQRCLRTMASKAIAYGLDGRSGGPGQPALILDVKSGVVTGHTVIRAVRSVWVRSPARRFQQRVSSAPRI